MVQDKWFEVYGKNGKAQLLRHLYIKMLVTKVKV